MTRKQAYKKNSYFCALLTIKSKMIQSIEDYLKEVQNFVAQGKEEMEQFRIRFNGKKGILNDS